MSNLIEIKQHPDKAAQSVGLARYNRSKMPGCWEMMQPGVGIDNRWITGLDENAASIKRIKDPVTRLERAQEVKEKREALEQLTGVSLSAELTNPFWSAFIIKIKDKATLDLDVPLDVVKYHVLLANQFTAPEIAIASTPEFINAKFYLSRTEEEAANRATTKRERDKAISKLYALSENKLRLSLIAKSILGTIIKEDMSADTIYNLVSDFIGDEKDKRGENLRKFIAVADKTTEELKYKITAIDAVDMHVIRFRDGLYQRGQITLGKTVDEVAKWLGDPTHSIELESIIEEIKDKKVYG